MTAPRIVSLAALAASLLFIVLTITQANGLTVPHDGAVIEAFCAETSGADVCVAEPITASLTH